MTSGSVGDGVSFQVSGPQTGLDDCFHALKKQRRVDETKFCFVFFPFLLLWVNTRLQVNAEWALSPTKSQLITTNRMVLPVFVSRTHAK